MNEPPVQRTTFARWLHHVDQHLALDTLGELSAAIRGDRRDPNPRRPRRAAVVPRQRWRVSRHAPRSIRVVGLLDLLAELDYEDGPAAEEAARQLLCDLGPWFIGTHAMLVRVEHGTVTLDYGGAARLAADPRYNAEAGR